MLTVLEYAFRAALVSCMLQRASIIHTDMALTRKKRIWITNWQFGNCGQNTKRISDYSINAEFPIVW